LLVCERAACLDEVAVTAALQEVPVASGKSAKELSVFREETMEAGKRFNSSWIDVGSRLARVASEKLFEAWSFSDIYAYAFTDLGLSRRKTDDLMVGFTFLKKYEPEAVKATTTLKAVPSQEIVSLLSKAEKRGELNEKSYQKVREVLMDAEVPLADKVAKVKEAFPAPKPKDRSEKDALKVTARNARKVCDDLATNNLASKKLRDDAEQLALALEALAASA
jgi:hypothetical protein